MALYFISGVPGTGKTTLVQELRKHGEEAHDADDECVRVSQTTGKVIDHEREPFNWIYPKESLNNLKSLSKNKNVFLAGSVDNFQDVYSASDEYIWMDIPLDLLINRLDSRSKKYGKSKKERQYLINLHKEMETVIGKDVFRLDSTKPAEQIADDLLKYTGKKYKITHPQP